MTARIESQAPAGATCLRRAQLARSRILVKHHMLPVVDFVSFLKRLREAASWWLLPLRQMRAIEARRGLRVAVLYEIRAEDTCAVAG